MKENAVNTVVPVTKAKAKYAFKKETVFTLIMLSISILAILDALTFPFGSGLYPIVIATICFGLAAGQVIVELRQKKLVKETMDVKVEESQKGKAAMNRALKFVGWYGGLLLSSYVIGFQIIALPWVFSLMIFQGHIKWWRSLVITAFVAIFILWIMPNILQMEPPVGLFQEWWRTR